MSSGQRFEAIKAHIFIFKRSVKDRLTLLQSSYKEKIRMEEGASGIECNESELDLAFEEINEVKIKRVEKVEPKLYSY